MMERVGGSIVRVRRFLAAGVMLAALALTAAPACAQLLPTDFFANIPDAPTGAARVEADSLYYDMDSKVIRAQGGVIMTYVGYYVRAERLVLNQTTGAMTAEGNVVLRDPAGIEFTADSVDVSGGFKQAVLRSVSITSPDGAVVTAADVNFVKELESTLIDASYSPCGLCVDEKGRKIGWRVRAAKMVHNDETKIIYLEEPQLELLGIPVAWLPFLWVEDPTSEGTGFRLPSFGYGEKTGVSATVPYAMPVTDTTRLLLTPSLFSRQGFMVGAEVTQKFDIGTARIWGSGIYQLDPGAFGGDPGNRDWRGAIQTSGRFTPLESWTAGWSYTAFSDSAYFEDYDLVQGHLARVNEAYVTYLDRDLYADVRVQQFNALGQDNSAQGQMPITYPNGRFDSVTELGNGLGQVSLSARLLALERADDDQDFANAVPYDFGYAGQRVHGSVELGWQDQFIAPAGLLITPYLAVRGDAAWYDGASGLGSAPPDSALLTLTPIGALDVRWPLISSDGVDSHLLEPIAQLAWRGSDVTAVGITNEDAQSFVFDDTNLFDFNRFSGSDRQETGLRANVGAHYLAVFEDGSWLDLIGGQSFQLAGPNAFAGADPVQINPASGLSDAESFLVLGARGSFMAGLDLGAKAQVDTDDFTVARAGVGASYGFDGFWFGLDYIYLAEAPALGLPDPQQEIAASASVPLIDYWSLNARGAWDLTANSFLEAGAGITYDDRFLMFGVDVSQTGPTHESPNDTRVMTKFALRTPDGGEFGL